MNTLVPSCVTVGLDPSTASSGSVDVCDTSSPLVAFSITIVCP